MRRLSRFVIVGALAGALGFAAPALAQGAGKAQCKHCGKQKAAATAQDADEAILLARQALAAGDLERFDAAAALVGSDHPLRLYIDYWRLRLRIADNRPEHLSAAADADIERFLERHPGLLVTDLLRRDWLLNLGKRQQWTLFDRQYPQWVLRDEPQPACYAGLSRLARGEAVPAETRELLMQPRDLPEACNLLLETMASREQLKPAQLWQRLTLSLEANAPPAIRSAAQLLNPALERAALDGAIARPQAALSGNAGRELTLIALSRWARTDPAKAAERLSDSSLRLPAADRAFVWSQIAAQASRRLMPEALGWSRQALQAQASDETWSWIARAALRAQDWPLVHAAIERMGTEGRRDPTWVYWRARALRERGDPIEATVLFASIADRYDFYGKLAAEELGRTLTVPQRSVQLSEAELAEPARNAGLARALKFYELGLRFEGNREWNFQLRGLNDRQLLAIAEWAHRRNVLDRAVNTADRTREQHDFALRFVTPFSDRLNANAAERELDPAWVYGLIRQESRFIMDARSSAGASGLMQLMPATARWVARKMGMRDFTQGRINDLETNLQLGTFYLRAVLDDLDGSPLLASAAYNAGPGRPKAWRSTLERPVEGAIFAETIPFTETRGYVKAVLSNATIYAAMFTGQPQSLKSRLGLVQPRQPHASELP